MSFFKKIKENIILNKKNEQRFYELAIEEIMTGTKRTGLWAMALSKSDGSLEKANALYIGLLAEEIKSDLYLEEIENEQLQKQLLLTEKVKKLEREKLDQKLLVRKTQVYSQANITINNITRPNCKNYPESHLSTDVVSLNL